MSSDLPDLTLSPVDRALLEYMAAAQGLDTFLADTSTTVADPVAARRFMMTFAAYVFAVAKLGHLGAGEAKSVSFHTQVAQRTVAAADKYMAETDDPEHSPAFISIRRSRERAARFLSRR